MYLNASSIEARVNEGSGESPDPSSSAAPKKRKGRPPGSKNKSTSKAKQVDSVPPEFYAKAWGLLGATVWDLVVVPTGRRSLKDHESEALGGAIAGVVDKYFPDLGEYGAETNLVLTVLGLWLATKKETNHASNIHDPASATEELHSNGSRPQGEREVYPSEEVNREGREASNHRYFGGVRGGDGVTGNVYPTEVDSGNQERIQS